MNEIGTHQCLILHRARGDRAMKSLSGRCSKYTKRDREKGVYWQKVPGK